VHDEQQRTPGIGSAEELVTTRSMTAFVRPYNETVPDHLSGFPRLYGMYGQLLSIVRTRYPIRRRQTDAS
jgi:hypothetical protein